MFWVSVPGRCSFPLCGEIDTDVVRRKFTTQHFRIVLVVILLDFELLLLPENLNSPDAFSNITRSPCQCFVRLRPI